MECKKCGGWYKNFKPGLGCPKCDMTPQPLSLQLEEMRELFFNIKVSKEGQFVGIKYRGEKRYHWITREAFQRLELALTTLITNLVNDCLPEKEDLVYWAEKLEGGEIGYQKIAWAKGKNVAIDQTRAALNSRLRVK